MKRKVGRPKKSKYNIVDYIGEKRNDWTILGFSHLNKNGDQYWEAQCKCGYISKIRVYPLLNGVTKSCKHCRPQSNSGQLSPWWKGKCEFSITYFNSIKNAANRRKIEFNISPEYIQELFNKQNRKCIYTDIELNFVKFNKKSLQTASLDRINSNKGYIEGNVQWVHKSINMMKMLLSHDKFIELCGLVSAKYGNT